MISKQKLLQWIAEKQFVYGEADVEDSEEEVAKWEGISQILSTLKRSIELGNLDIELGQLVVDNGEEVHE